MNKQTNTQSNRRQFLSRTIPACALTCFGAGSTLGLFQCSALADTGHKFDEDSGRSLSHRQILEIKYKDVIRLARIFEKEMGKDKAIECIKKATAHRMLAFGKRQASEMPNNDFVTYVDQFRSGYENELTMAITEDTETAFELKVTECIWADTFVRAKAGEIGFAWVCYGDYSWAQGFNHKIRLVRDKTLMQGDSHCNHRYVLDV